MIDIPAVWAWYGFLVLGGLLLFLAVVHLLNSLRHGSRMPVNLLVSSFFIFGVAAIIYFTWYLLADVDWSGTYTLILPNSSFIRFGQ